MKRYLTFCSLKHLDLEEDKGVDAAIAGFEKVLEMEKVVAKKAANW